jgi:Mechanosensitive ion channel
MGHQCVLATELPCDELGERREPSLVRRRRRLSLSHPYKAGDWIKIEGGAEGRIVELNWRATHILTGRQVLTIVPNSTIAKSKIANLNYASPIHGITIEVRLSALRHPLIFSRAKMQPEVGILMRRVSYDES